LNLLKTSKKYSAIVVIVVFGTHNRKLEPPHDLVGFPSLS